MIDHCARQLGLDPWRSGSKRLRQGDVTLHGWQLRSCGLGECLQKAAAMIQGDRLPRQSADGRYKRCIGIACMNHVSGNRGGKNFDGSSAMLRFQEDGRLVLYHGESDMGQGARTVLSQIVAETLGIAVDDVLVMPVDTDVSPFCFGSYSSRVTTVAGKAHYLAAVKLRKELLALAGKLLGVDPQTLTVKDGRVFPTADPEKGLTVKEVCQAAIRTQHTVGLTVYHAYDPPTVGTDQNFYGDYSSAYTYAAQAVEVEVDTETGQVRLLRVAAAHDLGKAVNPWESWARSTAASPRAPAGRFPRPSSTRTAASGPTACATTPCAPPPTCQGDPGLRWRPTTPSDPTAQGGGRATLIPMPPASPTR